MRTATFRTMSWMGALLLFIGQTSAQTPTAVTPAINTNTATAVNVGGTISLNSISYTVSAKKVLATGVEFYAARNATTNATNNFIRSDNKYSPTVFNQAQYEAFLASGKMSSFGTVYQYAMDGTNVTYGFSGAVAAIFTPGTGGLVITEFDNDPTVMAKPAKPGGTTTTTKPPTSGGGFATCISRCGNQASNCRANKPPGVDCSKQFDECIAGCRSGAGMPALVKNVDMTSHFIPTTKPIVK